MLKAKQTWTIDMGHYELKSTTLLEGGSKLSSAELFVQLFGFHFIKWSVLRVA